MIFKNKSKNKGFQIEQKERSIFQQCFIFPALDYSQRLELYKLIY